MAKKSLSANGSNWKNLSKQLLKKGVLLREDFSSLAVELLDQLGQLPKNKLPPKNTLDKIKEVVKGEVRVFPIFYVGLAKLAQAEGDLEGCYRLLEKAYDENQLANLKDVLDSFPQLKKNSEFLEPLKRFFAPREKRALQIGDVVKPENYDLTIIESEITAPEKKWFLQQEDQRVRKMIHERWFEAGGMYVPEPLCKYIRRATPKDLVEHGIYPKDPQYDILLGIKPPPPLSLRAKKFLAENPHAKSKFKFRSSKSKSSKSKKLSTRNLGLWPSAEKFKKLWQSLAVLSLCFNDEERYQFNENHAPGISRGFMTNGQGDELEIYFTAHGAVLRGFAHEAPMSTWSHHGTWPGLLKGLPKEFSDIKSDLLEDEDVSFCVWYLNSKKRWLKGSFQYAKEEYDPDGSLNLLEYLPFSPNDYAAYEGHYYSVTLDPKLVSQIYKHKPLSDKLIRSIFPKSKLTTKLKALARIGYF